MIEVSLIWLIFISLLIYVGGGFLMYTILDENESEDERSGLFWIITTFWIIFLVVFVLHEVRNKVFKNFGNEELED